MRGEKRGRAALAPAGAALIALALSGVVAAQPQAARVSFANSGAPAAQADFLRGLEALHNFEYEEANQAFVRARTADPSFAMAIWGEALTFHQTLWRNENVAAGREALARLGPSPTVRAVRIATPRERGFFAAVEALFGDGDVDLRRRRYAEQMAKLYNSDPDDPEAASFYALAMLGTMSRGLIGTSDSHEGHSASLAGSDTQRQVGEILTRVLARHPEHPGALHYLIHNYDDPEHASLGLDAARIYARVAMQSSHALHMPAHIFLQLGMWPEAEASDRAAFSASEAWVTARALPLTLRSYHSLSWRQYELLQMGRYEEAQQTIGVIEPVVKSSGQLTLLSDLSSMRARFVVETRRWDLMANERNFGNINELCAIGFAAARSGNPSLAELARQGLAARSQAAEEGDMRPAAAIMERQVAATIAKAAGRGAEALAIMQTASAAERQLPPPLGLPIPLKPSAELLGEMLIDAGKPAEAVRAFEDALLRNRGRTQSVLGLARASAALGQRDTARSHYERVLANLSRADAGVAEVAEARTYLETAASSSWISRSLLWTLAAIASLVAAGLVAHRRRQSTPSGKSAEVGAGSRKRRKTRRQTTSS